MKHARKDYNRIQDPANLIPADEPVMVIRAQDISAPNTLRFWAKEHRKHGGNTDMAILIESFAIEMEDWQKTHAVKIADMPS